LYDIQVRDQVVSHTISTWIPVHVTSAGLGPSGGRGGLTRHRILEATARLCLKRRGGELSVAEIASASGVFPNQVTHHFGSKDALLVHAAFLGLLHDAERMEKLGSQAADADTFRRNIARTVLALPSLPAVAGRFPLASPGRTWVRSSTDIFSCCSGSRSATFDGSPTFAAGQPIARSASRCAPSGAPLWGRCCSHEPMWVARRRILI
jgi:AcrR family transcriptional regulator